MNIGDNLKKIRKEKGFNQIKFANSLNISQSYLSDLENGRKNISIETAKNIADKLDVTLGYLTSGNKMLGDLTQDDKEVEMLKLDKHINETQSKIEANLKNNLFNLLQEDIPFMELHYLNNAYNFYELEKNSKDNILRISVILQMLRQHKNTSDEEIYKDILKEFDDFLIQYLDIK